MLRLFTRRRSTAGLRVFYATDIHGSEACYRKWLNAARVYEAKVLILGGDITGKILVPLRHETSGAVRGIFAGEEVTAADEDELSRLRRTIRDSGAYPVVVSEADAERLRSDPDFADETMNRCIAETCEEWIQLAEERLEAAGAVAYVGLGNDDPPDLTPILEQGTRLIYAEEVVHDIDDTCELISFGYSTPTPWDTPRELPEEELGERLRALVAAAQRPSTAIFNIHCPPFDTPIDHAPELDSEMRPRSSPGGGVVLAPVGSRAVKAVIEEMQPQLGLHGHVHESPGVAKLGRTLCINPGSDYASGVLRGALLELEDDGGLRQWQLVQG